MHPSKLFRHRPSAAMVVALVALFASLGGVGYAAVTLPAGSVGTNELQNGSVTNWKLQNGSVGNWKLQFNSVGARKIMNGAVGKGQINSSQVQARISSVCSTGAVTSVGVSGTVTCAAAPGAEFDTKATAPVTLPSGTAATTIAAESLPGGSPYLVTANPYVYISGIAGGASESVEVDCTLAAGSSATATQTRSVVVDLGANDQAQTIPLSVPAPASPNAITAVLSCVKKNTGAQSPKVTVDTAINALQTASNTTKPYAG